MPRPSSVGSRVGIEVELLAPVGGSRRDLAHRLAQLFGGRVAPAFHRDTEPAPSGRPGRYHHLSLAQVVSDADGRPRCRLVDDTTIRDDLDRRAPAPAGHYRIISDDVRMARLVERRADPAAAAAAVLEPVAELFGTAVDDLGQGRYRVDDAGGVTVAMVVPQGGQRERVCEVVTAVIDADHRAALAALLEPAEDAGYTVPAEAAVHVHFDAEVFRSGPRLAHLVQLFADRRDWLWQSFGTNPRCRRLAPVPTALVELVSRTGFAGRDWAEIEAELSGLALSKYCDLNLTNLVRRTPGKDTVEIRILPGGIDADVIVGQIATLERLVFDGDEGWGR